MNLVIQITIGEATIRIVAPADDIAVSEIPAEYQASRAAGPGATHVWESPHALLETLNAGLRVEGGRRDFPALRVRA